MVYPEEAYALTAAMEEQWKTQGIFPYDLAQTPEPYDAIKLPLVVKTAMDRILLPYQTPEDLIHLCELYNGDHLPGGLSPEEKERQVQGLRRQPFIRRVCRTEDCNELVVMSLRAAIISIEKYGLLPKPTLKKLGRRTDGFEYNPNRPFQPHMLCSQCADRRQSDIGTELFR